MRFEREEKERRQRWWFGVQDARGRNRREQNEKNGREDLSLSLPLLTSANGVKPKMPSLVSRPMLLATWGKREQKFERKKGKKKRR